jgi:hypothetical protein
MTLLSITLTAGAAGCGSNETTFSGPEGWYEIKKDTCAQIGPGTLGKDLTVTATASAPLLRETRIEPPYSAMICDAHPTGPGDATWTLKATLTVYDVAGPACVDADVRRVQVAADITPDSKRSKEAGLSMALGPNGYRAHNFSKGDGNGKFAGYQYVAGFCDGNLLMDVELTFDKGQVPDNAHDLAEAGVHNLAQVLRNYIRTADFTATPRPGDSGQTCQDSFCRAK